ncbi:MAG: tetratricopeptide repeat protein [Pirellulaceae bacterium]
MMQSHRGQSPLSSESPRSSRAPIIRRGYAPTPTLWAMGLLGAIVGFAIGVFSFWADSRPPLDDESWSWQLPELPVGIEPAYRRQCEEVGAAVAQVLEAHPDSPHAVSALGVLCYIAHDTPGETSCWERCVALDPQHALAFSRLFALAEQEANYQRIVDLAREAEAREPRNVAHRGWLGSALMHLRRYEEAKEVLEQRVNEGQGDADTYLVLGEVWYQLDQPRKAKRCFEAATALAPYNSAMVFSLAKACAKLGETELATHYRAKFQELKEAETGAQEGDTSTRQEVRDEVHIPIRTSEIMRHVGQAYQDANELEWAERSWLQAAALNREDTASRELLCDLYSRQRRPEEALKYVRELQRIEPQNRLHDRNEGLFLSRLKRYDEAEKVFRELCRQEPTGSAGYASLAELLLLRGGDVREAQSLAQRAAEFDMSGPNLFRLALVAQQAGDLTTARRAIDQALALEPENPDYRRLYASIYRPN